MLKHRILLTSALAGVEMLAGAACAQAGGMGHFSMPQMNMGSLSSRLNCPPGMGGMGGNRGGGSTNVYAPVRVTTNINNSTHVNVNKSLNVYSPVTVNSNINNSVAINNSQYIDTSTNVSVNKEINIRTTNIFNGRMGGGGGSDHSQGGNWGSHSGWGNNGGGSWGGGGSSQNNNGNENNNGNSNDNSSHVNNSNTNNNSNSIDASGAIDSFFNGLRGFQ